jgi:hypothetical protein
MSEDAGASRVSTDLARAQRWVNTCPLAWAEEETQYEDTPNPHRRCRTTFGGSGNAIQGN